MGSKEKVIEKLKQMSGHNNIEMTDSGNTAIFAALYCARKMTDLGKVLIPDQGGWLTYPKYPKMLQMDVETVKTDNGLIDLEDLKKKVSDAKILLYADYGGYFVKQDVKKIYEICKGKCFVIIDACASIGYEQNGEYCDILLSSFGRWKPVNLKYGGFLSTNNKDLFEHNEIFNTINFDEEYYAPLLKKLELADVRQKFLREKCNQIKKELKEFNVLHRKSECLNVAVAFGSEEEKEKIINYCNERNYEYTLCPRYIRVNRDAVCIEVKRLEG